MSLGPLERRELIALARTSIESALPEGRYSTCERLPSMPALMERRSSFVTLRTRGQLRGCCGSLDAARPLAEDVWRNAWACAFSDPRFPRLSRDEWPHVHLHISVLSPLTPMTFLNEEDLIAQLRPFVDGLIIEAGEARATFLPAVWNQIVDPRQFVRQLKCKAQLPADYWSPELRAYRYTTESFE
ncbi:MAG TPA: AmmeMemoRadiSam system protein A [Steroidobacter sp.]